jgi:hypothetical protein
MLWSSFIGMYWMFCAMTQPGEFRIWPRLGLRAWVTLIVTLVVTAAILIAIAAIAFGILLFLLPVFALGALLYYLFPSKFRPAYYRHTRQSEIIDGEFRVVDAVEIERKRPEEGP